MNARFTKVLKTLTFALAIIAVLFGQVSLAAAQSSEPPKPETVTLQGKTVLKGFDPEEFGGNDSDCTRTELESIHIGEVVSSPNEKCLVVVEWSLKNGEETVLTGVHALPPGEWYYVPLAVGGYNDQVRVVGTLWYLPKGWNSHQYAIDIAKDRDVRDATDSIVGLSPTDPWVLAQIDALSGRAPLATAIDTIVPSTPLPTSTPAATEAAPTTTYTEAYAKEVCGERQVDSFNPTTGQVECQRVEVRPSWVTNSINWLSANWFWVIFALLLTAGLFLAFRRPSAPVAPVAPKAAAPRRKTAPKKKSTKK